MMSGLFKMGGSLVLILNPNWGFPLKGETTCFLRHGLGLRPAQEKVKAHVGDEKMI